MLDAFFLEVLAVIGFVVEADYRAAPRSLRRIPLSLPLRH